MSLKKSFHLYKDTLCVLEDLTPEQRGDLFYAIYKYQIGEELELEGIIKIAFSQFKNQFIRDEDNYQKVCLKNKKIAEKRWSTKSTSGKNGIEPLPTSTKSTDKDKDKDKDKDNKKSTKPKFYVKEFRPDWFPEKDWDDLIAHRKKKRAPETERAWKSLIEHFQVAVDNGHTITKCVDTITNRGWTGFDASWMENGNGKKNTPKTFTEITTANRQQALREFAEG